MTIFCKIKRDIYYEFLFKNLLTKFSLLICLSQSLCICLFAFLIFQCLYTFNNKNNCKDN